MDKVYCCLVSRIVDFVDQDCIGGGRSAENNAVHGVGL